MPARTVEAAKRANIVPHVEAARGEYWPGAGEDQLNPDFPDDTFGGV